jgi:hypothetical protein
MNRNPEPRQPEPWSPCPTCGRWGGTPCSTGCPNTESRKQWCRENPEPKR